MNTTIKRLVFFVLFVFVAQACIKEEFAPEDIKTPTWKPIFAVPIATGSFTIADILDTIPNSSSFEVDEDGLISLVYSGNLYSLRPNNILEIPNQSFNENHSIPLSEQTALLEGQTIAVNEQIVFPINIPLDNDGDHIRIDKVFFNDGTLSCFANVSDNLSGSAILTINELRNFAGEVFELELPLSPGSNAIALDLAGYVLNLVNMGTDNELTIEIEASITASDDFSEGEASLSYGAIMQDLKFSRIEGYFGNLTLSTDRDSIELTFFEDVAGYVNLVNPQINLHVQNSFGMSAEVEFLDFESHNQETGVITQLTGPGFPQSLIIEGAEIVEMPTTLEVEINEENTNLNDLLNTTPKLLYGRVQGTSNPANDPTSVNFIDEDSELNIDIDLRIPMWGRGEVVFTDTFNLALSDIEDVEDIDSASVRFIFDNGFPIDMITQVYLLDSLNQITDSLFINSNGQEFPGGVIDNEGKITSPVKTLFDVPLTNDRVKIFTSVEKLILKAAVNTTGVNNDKDVKFYDHYKLDFSMGLKFFPTINLNDEV